MSQIKEVSPWIALLFSMVTTAVGIVVWSYTTFATMKYVDDKHLQAIHHADKNFETNREMLKVMIDKLNVIDQRTFEMHNRKNDRPRDL